MHELNSVSMRATPKEALFWRDFLEALLPLGPFWQAGAASVGEESLALFALWSRDFSACVGEMESALSSGIRARYPLRQKERPSQPPLYQGFLDEEAFSESERAFLSCCTLSAPEAQRLLLAYQKKWSLLELPEAPTEVPQGRVSLTRPYQRSFSFGCFLGMPMAGGGWSDVLEVGLGEAEPEEKQAVFEFLRSSCLASLLLKAAS